MSATTTEQTAALRQPEEGVEPDDLDTKSIVVIALISTALLLASVLGVTWFVGDQQKRAADKRVIQVKNVDAEDELQAQRDKLAATAGEYGITIDEAKQLVVEELTAENSGE